jgi:hypothetical protein
MAFELQEPDRTPLGSDPQLKEAMANINAIMKKFDIGGHVVLVSKTHSEFKFFFEPTWSAIRWEGEGVRIKAKKDELGSQAAVQKVLGYTAHLILQIMDIALNDAKICRELTMQLSKHVDIIHKPGSHFTPHREG